MNFFDRLSNGWSLGKTSLMMIRDNPSLLLFPVISGFSLMLVTMSFFGSGYFLFGEEILALADKEAAQTIDILLFVMGFLFYLINYCLIAFFNVGLVHCAKMIMEGKEPTVGDGIRFAQSRMGVILAWGVLAATVGMILKAIQERAGALGGIITGIIGVIWGIATFFVVPVIAYENVGPLDAVKRSALIMKEKWGESIGASFSFSLFSFLGILLIALPSGFSLGYLINPIVGVVAGLAAFLIIQVTVSAAQVVFLAAVYQHVNNEPIGSFDGDTLDHAFYVK